MLTCTRVDSVVLVHFTNAPHALIKVLGMHCLHSPAAAAATAALSPAPC